MTRRHFRLTTGKYFDGNLTLKSCQSGLYFPPGGMGGCIGAPRDGSSPNGDSSDGTGMGQSGKMLPNQMTERRNELTFAL